MIQDGFIYGMFKVTNDRGKLDCIHEGMTVLRATIGLFYKIVTKTDRTEMDLYNLAEFIITLSERCNYHSTLQGLVVSKIIREKVDFSLRHHPKWRKVIATLLVSYEAMVNVTDDTIVVAMASIGFY